MKLPILSTSLLAALLAAQANGATISTAAVLSGANESPPVVTAGTGFARVILDTTLHTLFVGVSFSGLNGTTTASHIHCCTAVPGTGNVGVATQLPTFAGFPLGVTSGTYTNLFDLTQASSWSPSFITASGSIAGAEARLISALGNGTAYLNIHTATSAGGEIRGFLTPEPGTTGLVGVSLAGLLIALRRRAAQRP